MIGRLLCLLCVTWCIYANADRTNSLSQATIEAEDSASRQRAIGKRVEAKDIIFRPIHENHIDKLFRSPHSHMHECIFAIERKNAHLLEAMLLEVSNPQSSQYGQYLTRQELGELTANTVAVEAVESFMQNYPEAKQVSKTLYGEYLTYKAPVSVWERIFATEFYHIKESHFNPTRKETAFVARAKEYTIPQELVPHVKLVYNTVQTPVFRLQPSLEHPAGSPRKNAGREAKQQQESNDINNNKIDNDKATRPIESTSTTTAGTPSLRASSLASSTATAHSELTTMSNLYRDIDILANDDDYSDDTSPLTDDTANTDDGGDTFTTPAILIDFYNIHQVGNNLTTQIVYATNNYTYSKADLDLFNTMYSLSGTVQYNTNGHVNDNVCATNEVQCAEPNLDIQYITAIGQGVNTWFYYDDSSDFLITWVTEVLDLTPLPSSLSISYGSYEEDIDDSQMDDFDLSIISLGLLGSTMVAGSGDDGVAGVSARTDSSKCKYNPFWPSTSPYVLSIGATQGPEAGSTEIACSADTGGIITSGGGFSNHYYRPSWQKSFVSKYFTRVTDSASGYNVSGRGYPDVAVMGRRYSVIIGQQQTFQSGVSAATPVVAAMLAIVNSHRLALGRPLLGFINPYLYQNYTRFANDITSGNNKCAEHTNSICCTEGFEAATGWDPVTGLGSINFPGFYDLILNHGYVYTPFPTAKPTSRPTAVPTAPTAKPTARPSASPTTALPSARPTARPTTKSPTVAPTAGVNATKSTSNAVIIGIVVAVIIVILIVIVLVARYCGDDKEKDDDDRSKSSGFTDPNNVHGHDFPDNDSNHPYERQPSGNYLLGDITSMIGSFFLPHDPHKHGHHHHHHHHLSNEDADDPDGLNSGFSDDIFEDFMPDVKEFELSAGLSAQLQLTFSADNCEARELREAELAAKGDAEDTAPEAAPSPSRPGTKSDELSVASGSSSGSSSSSSSSSGSSSSGSDSESDSVGSGKGEGDGKKIRRVGTGETDDYGELL